MAIKTVGFGPALKVHSGSDIRDFAWNQGALTLRVAREVSEHSTRGLEIVFQHVSGLKFLDELDLARYWTSAGFAQGFHVLEVLSDGWASEEDAVQGYPRPRREWLVVTGNGCASLFAPEPPCVSEISWAPDGDS